MRTLSPIGGCVVMAVTRHTPGFAGSTAADSIVVFGSATVARLSHERTGLAFGIAGFGAGNAGPAPRPPPRPATGAPCGAPRPAGGWPCPCAAVTSSAITDVIRKIVRCERVMTKTPEREQDQLAARATDGP